MAKSDGSVRVDTKLDTSGFDKGMAGVKQKLASFSGSLNKLGSTIKKTFSQSNTAVGGKGYEELRKEIVKTEAQLSKLIEKQIRFVETGGNIKSRTMAGMEYDIEMTRNRLEELRNQLSLTSEETPRKVGKMNAWIERLKKSFDSLNKTTRRSHYSILKMLGTSLLFSTVFRAISVVTKGFIEGINNLSQYSDKANNTMSALKSSLTQLKNSFATAFMPIITAVTPAITQFMSLISKATSVVAAFFSALTGNKTYSKAIEVQEDYAASLDKTANAAKDAANNVNKLDELNIISNDKSENKGLLPENMFTEEKIDSPILNLSEKVRTVIDKVKKFIKNEDWKDLGEYISDGIVGALEFLNEKLKEFDWIGLGEDIGEFLSGIDWVEIIKSGLKLKINFWKILAEIWVGSFDAAPLETSIITALAAFKFTGLGAAVTSSLASAISTSLASAGITIPTLGIAVTVGVLGISWIINMLPGLSTDIGQWFQKEVNGIEISDEEYHELLKGTGMLPEEFGVILENWWNTGSIFTPKMKELFEKGFKEYVSDPISKTWENIKENSKKAIEQITDAIRVKLNPLITLLNQTWENIKESSKKAIEQITDAIRVKLNPLITVLNQMLSRITDGVNGMIDALNALKFDVPDWVPVIGGKSFGLNIGGISNPQIPYLASGAVIPPNAPFMAMLGDQKHGTNLEAPEDLIRQIVREEAGGGKELIPYLKELIRYSKETAEKDLTIGDRAIAKANARGMRSMGYSLMTET